MSITDTIKDHPEYVNRAAWAIIIMAALGGIAFLLANANVLAVTLLLVLFGLGLTGLVLGTSFFYIPEGKIGIITAKLPVILPSVRKDWPYRVVPEWYNGVWASHFVTGWRFLLLHKLGWAQIELRDIPVIPDDRRGYVIALIGQDIPGGKVMEIENYDLSDFANAGRFLEKSNGKKTYYRGPTAVVLSPGGYNLFARVLEPGTPIPANEAWPFVIRLIEPKEVAEGEGLVLIAKVGGVPESGQWAKVGDKEIVGLVPFIKLEDIALLKGEKSSGGDPAGLALRIAALTPTPPPNPGLMRGVMNRAFGPGKYFFHPEMFKAVPGDVTPINVSFKGTSTNDDNFPKVAAFTSDPFEVKIEFEVGIQVPLPHLPIVIAMNENIKGVKKDIIVPQANGIIYDVLASLDLLNFISRRADFSRTVEAKFKEELEGNYFVKFLYFRILDLDFEDQAKKFIEMRNRVQLAQKEVEAVQEETKVAEKQVEFQSQVARGEGQKILIDAELRKTASQDIAAATKTRGDALKQLASEAVGENPIVKLFLLLASTPDGLNKVFEGLSQRLSKD